MSKHRKMKSRTKKFAAVTAATATTAALTVGAAPSPDKEVTWRDVLLTAGPDYFQLIEDMSSSLTTSSSPKATSTKGSSLSGTRSRQRRAVCLPSFNSRVQLRRPHDALRNTRRARHMRWKTERISRPFPGIPAGTATAVLALLLRDSVWTLGPLGSVFDSLGGLNGVLGSTSDVLDLVRGLQLIGLLDDTLDLSELLGLTANQSSLTQTWNWLGLTEQTNIGNTYVNLDQLTLSGLVENLDDALDSAPLGRHPWTWRPPRTWVSAAGPRTAIDEILVALDIVSTPEVTAWIPPRRATTTFRWAVRLAFWQQCRPSPSVRLTAWGSVTSTSTALLAALGVDGLVDLDSATVVAIPIFAAGAELPAALPSFGVVNANVLFPTATGVTQLAGTSLQTLNIPLLSSGFTNLNTLQASYVGTNGINYNSGQSVLLANWAACPFRSSTRWAHSTSARLESASPCRRCSASAWCLPSRSARPWDKSLLTA